MSPSALPLFFVGVVLSHVLRLHYEKDDRTRISYTIDFIVLGSALAKHALANRMLLFNVGAAADFVESVGMPSKWSPLFGILKYFHFCGDFICALAIYVTYTSPHSILHSVFSTKMPVTLGPLTLSLYIFHQPVIAWYRFLQVNHIDGWKTGPNVARGVFDVNFYSQDCMPALFHCSIDTFSRVGLCTITIAIATLATHMQDSIRTWMSTCTLTPVHEATSLEDLV